MKIVSIIPARGGSKEIPRKNLLKINGIPLVGYSIKQSLASKLIDETYVSTEDKKIRDVSKSYGAKVIQRPEILASDIATTDEVLVHAAVHLKYNFDYMVCLQPTSPIRPNNVIDYAISLMVTHKKKKNLISAAINDRFLWFKEGFPINFRRFSRERRQDRKWEYAENGSIYIVEKEHLKVFESRYSYYTIFYVMPKWMSFEIDGYFDLDLIKFIMRNMRNKKWK